MKRTSPLYLPLSKHLKKGASLLVRLQAEEEDGGRG